MSAIEDLQALIKERDNLATALFEVVDAVASIDKPWDLHGYGIEPKRAEEICELAEIGKPRLAKKE